jgi:hypothetical protein
LRTGDWFPRKITHLPVLANDGPSAYSIWWIEIGLQNYGDFSKKRRNLPKKLPRTAKISLFPASSQKKALTRPRQARTRATNLPPAGSAQPPPGPAFL